MSIKRFQDAISIISSRQASTADLHTIQHDINHIIHNNLYNFMLPHKVKEIIDSLTPLFVKMKELKPLPHRVEKKRTELYISTQVIPCPPTNTFFHSALC